MFTVQVKPNEKDVLAAIQQAKVTNPQVIRVSFLSHKLNSRGTGTYTHVNHIMEFHVQPKADFYDTFLKSGKLSKRIINCFYPEIQRCDIARIEGIDPTDDSHMT